MARAKQSEKPKAAVPVPPFVVDAKTAVVGVLDWYRFKPAAKFVELHFRGSLEESAGADDAGGCIVRINPQFTGRFLPVKAQCDPDLKGVTVTCEILRVEHDPTALLLDDWVARSATKADGSAES